MLQKLKECFFVTNLFSSQMNNLSYQHLPVSYTNSARIHIQSVAIISIRGPVVDQKYACLINFSIRHAFKQA